MGLYLGAEGLVRGSSNLSLRLGVSPLLVGLTVVAFGTSAPELTVSVLAGFEGHGDVAVGNVVGSNIINIALILGLSALIRPLKVNRALVRRDIPIMIVVSLALIPIVLGGGVGRIGGLFLFSGIVLYIIYSLVGAKREDRELTEGIESQAVRPPARGWAVDMVMIIGGLVFLILGSKLLVSGALAIARGLNVPEAVIGLTIVAAGTSLPELATSAVAALKRQADLAVGNIVGSNIFNVLCILGASAMVSPLEVRGIHLVDALVMEGLSLLLLPLAFTRLVLSRAEGALMLLVYAGYLYWLWPGQ